MLFLISHYWGWLAAIAGVGLLIGSMSSKGAEPDQSYFKWFSPVFGLFAVGIAAAAAHWLLGRPAVWLETALLAFVSYVVGGAVGAIVTGASPHPRKAWWGGGVIAGLIWLCSSALGIEPVEALLKPMAADAVKTAGGDPALVDVSGRDALLAISAGDAAKRMALAGKILEIDGVRQVNEVAEIPVSAKAAADAAAAAKEATDKAAADAATAKATAEKAAADQAAAAKAVADKAAGDKAAADKALADKAAADKAAADKALAAKAGGVKTAAEIAAEKAALIAASGALPSSGPLSAAQCQTALGGLVASEKIVFATASATISDQSKALIGKVGAILGRCAESKFEISGHTDSTGDPDRNKALSERRAQAVVDELVKSGADKARLTAVGHGADTPIATNDTDDGRAENRRIEFKVN